METVPNSKYQQKKVYLELSERWTTICFVLKVTLETSDNRLLQSKLESTFCRQFNELSTLPLLANDTISLIPDDDLLNIFSNSCKNYTIREIHNSLIKAFYSLLKG